jgi:hypothetical protein
MWLSVNQIKKENYVKEMTVGNIDVVTFAAQEQPTEKVLVKMKYKWY